jgi:hypothetical protein
MDNGFGTNLEGFLIHGNLSLNPSLLPAINGDGSIEASGTFYIDTVREYNNTNNGIDIQQVKFYNDYIEIPFSNPSNTSTGTLLINGGITINNTTDSTSLTSGGTLTTLGGISIGKKLNVGDIINCNDHKIVNVSWPTDPLDAANKAYVDSKTYGSGNLTGNFTSGQIIIGGSSGNVIGYPSFIYNPQSGLVISNTTDAIGLTTGSIITNGGVSISKSLYVGGSVDVGGNYIHEVSTPVLPNDAVNKAYVDNLISHFTGGSTINYNFTSGQILIGSAGNSVIGNQTFVFTESAGIFIYNTTDALGLGTGGALTISGGLSVDKHVFIGKGLDVNNNIITGVAPPMKGTDAVNKDYLLALLASLPGGGGGGGGCGGCGGSGVNTLLLQNNVLSGIDIPLLNANAGVTVCFVAYIYIHTDYGNGSYSGGLYSITCFYNGSIWIYNTKYTGTVESVKLLVVQNDMNVKIQYTNGDKVNTTVIQYYIDQNIHVSPISQSQVDYTLPSTADGIYSDFVTYSHTSVLSATINVFITTVETASLYILDILYKGSEFVLKYERIGPDLGVKFRITSDGVIQYTYYRADNANFLARVTQFDVLYTYTSLKLNNSTYDGSLSQVNVATLKFVRMYIYVERPSVGQYAYFTVEGFYYNDSWYANSTFIGDSMGVLFSLDNQGNLKYINPDQTHLTNIKVLVVNPKAGECGCLNYLEPYSVLIGNGYGPIINTTEFTYKDCVLKMSCPSAQIVISNTSNAIGLGTGGNLTLAGGASIGKSLYVGGPVNVGGNYIHDVLTPSQPNDAVNKAYVDNLLSHFTGGNTINFNFTSGQILIGSAGNTVIGNQTFIFSQDNGIFINNTTNAIGLGSGGALTITGGLSVDKQVFIGGGLDVNNNKITGVAPPVNGMDAVNKNYLDSLIENLPCCQEMYTNSCLNTFLLKNNVSTATDIPLLTENAGTTVCFIAYIYIHVSGNSGSASSCIYTITCYYNGNKWIYNTKFSGSITQVNFVVIQNGLDVKIQYTNADTFNTTTIQYYVDQNFLVTPTNSNQVNYNLISTDLGVYADFLNYTSIGILSVKVQVFISTVESAAFYSLDILYKGESSGHVLHCERIGDDLGVVFRMNGATLQYTYYRPGSGSSFTARVIQFKTLDTFKSLVLNNSTYGGTLPDINVTTQFVRIYIYVEKPILGQYAYFTVEGFYYNNSWYAYSGFVGDSMGILFSIENNGDLKYINPDPVNLTNVKILVLSPKACPVLNVMGGGTGQTYFQPYSVLIGDGSSPIMNTTDFIYKDCSLQMKCHSGNIVIYNTSDAVGLGTGGNLTLAGGASVGKSLYVGGGVYVNNVDISPSSGDINEHLFYADNNQIIKTYIPGFMFNTDIVKSFIAQISITVTLSSYDMDSLVILKAINTSKGWKLIQEIIGDDTGIVFYCNNDGRIQYTSTNLSNWIQTKISYRATTTSV